MCGIIGYTGCTPALPVLLKGLAALEYRGYDSAGVALACDRLRIVKSRGRLSALEERIARETGLEDACCGIGHTRWATHGAPEDRNAHPHSTRHLTLVHNGILENYAELTPFLREKGYSFCSETDTEVGAALIDWFYDLHHDPVRAILDATALLHGSFAFGVIFRDLPEQIFAIRQNSPLIVAVTEQGGLIASDVPAILPYSKDYYRMEEDVVAVLKGDSARFFSRAGEEVLQRAERVEWDVEQAQKGGYPHFMIKEILEEPEALRKTVSRFLRDGMPNLELPQGGSNGADIGRVHIVACGTAMHAGLIGKRVIERFAKLPVQVEMASEFRYRMPILMTNDLVILLSQSGETADTLAALRLAKEQGVPTLAIVNVVGSSVAIEADHVLYTPAGPEIAVASTKAYSVQCALLYLLALHFALGRGEMQEAEVRVLSEALLRDMPRAVQAVLACEPQIRALAARVKDAAHLFYIGRDVDYDLCVEGSLKLKEISYIHSEAYAAGELKHGTISLIEQGTPVVAVVTVPRLAEKMISGIREVKARGAWVLAVVSAEIAARFNIPCDELLVLPEIGEKLTPFPTVCALQLLAYHVAEQKGLDVDKPRNLAKSVTVE